MKGGRGTADWIQDLIVSAGAPLTRRVIGGLSWRGFPLGYPSQHHEVEPIDLEGRSSQGEVRNLRRLDSRPSLRRVCS